MIDQKPARSTVRRVRLYLWALALLAAIGFAGVFLAEHSQSDKPEASVGPVRTHFGGPFALVDATGRPFSSRSLEGKPYALYFGFTRCGDVCPTTLSRLVKLRREAANDRAMQIVFITIDPANDGPKEVGQYALLFNAPIIGLTGNSDQIQQVKRQFGIYAQPVANAPMGKAMEHTAIILLFDARGEFEGTISPDEPDEDALSKIRKLVA